MHIVIIFYCNIFILQGRICLCVGVPTYVRICMCQCVIFYAMLPQLLVGTIITAFIEHFGVLFEYIENHYILKYGAEY